jgi:hypothetical protein
MKAFGTGTVTFKNSMRLTSGNTTLRTPVPVEKLTLKVFNQDYNLGSYTGIAFSADGTAGLDPRLDSNRLGTFISLYSHLQDGSEQLGIQTREAFENGIEVPLGFETQLDQEVTYIISISDISGDHLGNATVYLIDNLENTITDLTQNNYRFVSKKGSFNERFTVKFEEELLNSEMSLEQQIIVYPNPTTNVLNILSPNAAINSITVYDLGGRKVEDINLNNSNSYRLHMNQLQSAMYFVTITTDSGLVTKRVGKN